MNFSKGANRTRKDFVADQVLSRVAELVHSGTLAPTVGVYRLTTKTGRQLPRVERAGHNEAHQGQGCARGGVQAHVRRA